MTQESTRTFFQLGSLALALGVTCAVTLTACTPPAAPAKEAEEISPAGPLGGVEAEAISNTDEPRDKPATDGAAEGASAGATPKFEDLSPGDKLQLMKTSVAPQMRELFQGHDAKEFAEFGCSTCHGAGAREGNFKMPSAALPALNKAEMDAHPAMSAFMAKSVVPEMAKLLGEPTEGEHAFGCFNCHTKKD